MILFDAFHSGLCHGGHDGGATAQTLAESMGPIADLADMYGDIGVLRCGCDCELGGYEKDVERVERRDAPDATGSGRFRGLE